MSPRPRAKMTLRIKVVEITLRILPQELVTYRETSQLEVGWQKG